MNKETRTSLDLKAGGSNKGDTSNLFKWMIDGFSILHNQSFIMSYSGNFKACGFTWRLQLDPNTTAEENLNRYVSLRLILVDNDTSPNSVVKANYKLVIYDQLLGKHVEKEGEQWFHERFPYRLYCKVSWLEFNNPNHGLLVNDCCIFGVQVHDACVLKLVPDGVLELWTIKKDTSSTVYNWEFKDFLTPYVNVVSYIFDAGNYKWYIVVRPNVANFLGVSLVLDKPSALPPKTGILVDFSLTTLGQKCSGRRQYSREHPSWGTDKLMEWKEVIRELRHRCCCSCTVEASVTVLGVVNIS
ncbi:putative inactive serine/threonine-protein kinase fnkC isoform X1 [Canna indica]|uniref:Inactive serine/threonine-protein kinase fnkC isoform X1 n=1 Tax=Canna indica TaxID=4628 RepID=A0AAQ3KE09_9LILI|nr:putative inactive serine/threonine-protein kinase fnkC isoform X1 [Canna indica]